MGGLHDIIPELKNSAFGDASARQVMDMTTALQYSENYADPNAVIWHYAAAANPMPKPANYQGPSGYFSYLQTLKNRASMVMFLVTKQSMPMCWAGLFR